MVAFGSRSLVRMLVWVVLLASNYIVSTKVLRYLSAKVAKIRRGFRAGKGGCDASDR